MPGRAQAAWQHAALCALDPQGSGTNSRRIGNKLAGMAGRIVDGRRLEDAGKGRTGVIIWRVAESDKTENTGDRNDD